MEAGQSVFGEAPGPKRVEFGTSCQEINNHKERKKRKERNLGKGWGSPSVRLSQADPLVLITLGVRNVLYQSAL